ncbi:MAG: DUF2442 domain-containing protein, partial [Acidobacteriaceae bacterium]|nr:DUF2442 domain-containing protein [Acidobacteriaceae bacterium]
MCADAITQEHHALDIIPPIQATAPEDVRDVIPLPGYRLAVRFFDGTAGTVNLSALVTAPDAGVFAALRAPELFEKVYIQYGAVTWPGEIDLAPDAMYDAIKEHGEWILTGLRGEG